MTKRIEFQIDHHSHISKMTAFLWEDSTLIAHQVIEQHSAMLVDLYADMNIRNHSEYVLALDPTVEINTTPTINDYRKEAV